MNNEQLITQTMLNVLTERVCRPFSYLAVKITSDTPLWEGPIKMCQRIENNLFAVDSVIIEAKRTHGYFSGSLTPRLCEAVLCRVYILLYYNHEDEQLYQEVVYPRLKDEIGPYYRGNIEAISQRIDEVIRLEKKVRISPFLEPMQRMMDYTAQHFAEVRKERETLNARIKELEGENAKLKERLSVYLDDDDSGEENEDILRNKVSFEFFLRLLEQAGLDLDNTGNKKRAGELWHIVTGKSADDLRKFCSNRNEYNNNHTRKDIERLNDLLDRMGISKIVL